MGDIPFQSTSVSNRPGIMLVRPSLHTSTDDNSATLKRWTAVHFRDMLNCPTRPNSTGMSRALRFTNTAGGILHTIHVDDITVFKTDAYYKLSRRLDLENTRALEDGEKAILADGHGFGMEPMIWDLVDAEFAILEEYKDIISDEEEEETYHNASLSAAGQDKPQYALLTLTSTSASNEETAPPKHIIQLRDKAFDLLYDMYGVAFQAYASLYRRVPDAQPAMHLVIEDGKDGSGVWIVCVMVEGETTDAVREQLQEGMESWVEQVKDEMTGEDWNVKVGVWDGDLFVV